MGFKNIQNEETLKKFLTSRGFEIPEYSSRENNINYAL